MKQQSRAVPPWEINIPGTGGIKPTKEAVAAWEQQQQPTKTVANGTPQVPSMQQWAKTHGKILKDLTTGQILPAGYDERDLVDGQYYQPTPKAPPMAGTQTRRVPDGKGGYYWIREPEKVLGESNTPPKQPPINWPGQAPATPPTSSTGGIKSPATNMTTGGIKPLPSTSSVPGKDSIHIRPPGGYFNTEPATPPKQTAKTPARTEGGPLIQNGRAKNGNTGVAGEKVPPLTKLRRRAVVQ